MTRGLTIVHECSEASADAGPPDDLLADELKLSERAARSAASCGDADKDEAARA